MATQKFVNAVDGKFSVPMTGTGRNGEERTIQHLLWGDRVTVLEEQGARAKVKARGLTVNRTRGRDRH